MDDIKKFNQELCSIKYGWHDKCNKLYTNLKDGHFVKDYKMQDINNISNSGYAICWELVELERKFFKDNNIPFMTIFAYMKLNNKYPCHTFLVYMLNDKYFWFEASWDKFKGIREFNSLDELFDVIRDNFGEFTRGKEYDKDKIIFKQYFKVRRGITCNPFYYHCLYFGKKIS